MSLLRGLTPGVLIFQRSNSTSGVVYRFAKKKDMESLLAMHKRYIVEDEHYKGLGGSAEEAVPLMEFTIRDMLRYPYSMLAYDNSKPIAFSMISVRHRDKAKDNLKKLGPLPPVSNYSYILRMVDWAEEQMWEKKPDYETIGVARTIYVEPEYRRKGVGTTLLETQYEGLQKMRKDAKELDAIISVSTGTANFKQLEKIGFKREMEVPDRLYRKDNGQSWDSTDQLMPRAVVMTMQF